MRLFSKIFLLCSLILILPSCGGRIPSPETAQDIMKDHFNDYAKKYKESFLGGHKVEKVEIEQIEEVQKGLALATARISLDDGTSFKVHMTFLHKYPLGWRQQGWEKADATATSFP